MVKELKEKIIDKSHNDFDTTFATTMDYLKRIEDYKQQDGFNPNSVKKLENLLDELNGNLKIYLSQIRRNVRA